MTGVSDPFNLQRFIDAQDAAFRSAMCELRSGKKRGHWMWFVFPQLAGLGRSQTAQYYGIGSLDEARAYLEQPLLARRFHEALGAILDWSERSSTEQILGPVDAMKLRSSLTLFDQVEPGGMCARALDSFYDGRRDQRTLALLNGEA